MSQSAQPPADASAAAGSAADPAPGAPTSFATDPSESMSTFRDSRRAYLDAHPGFDAVAVGAFVFDPAGRLLLVQRAAHDSMPLRWEIPGGACDAEDESLLHAAARELWEEAGLRATVVGPAVGGGHVFRTRRGLRVCKHSFVVRVDGYAARLDPDEHQALVWASEAEARAGRCGDVELVYTTREQEESIYEAFGVWKARPSPGTGG
ncbi:NUDIX hydrolase domain-like protein [Xylariaceae sp. FL0804]|nr:NUDIX hydrolase domain-like protein [Xylariaceae sp. FL0804]